MVKGKKYDTFELAALRGWSSQHKLAKLQPIWKEFQRTKNMDTNRDNLWKQVTLWSDELGIEVDEAVYIGKGTLEDYVNLKLTPYGHISTFKTSDRGKYILCCAYRSPEQSVEANRIYNTEEWSEGTQHMGEGMSLSESDPRSSPKTFEASKLCVATFAGLNWALFRKRCPYYKMLLVIRLTMSPALVSANTNKFRAELCRQITWSIIEDGIQFFNTHVHPEAFLRGNKNPDYPVSHLDDVLQNVYYGRTVERISFPLEWSAYQQLPHRQGGQGGGYQGHQPPTQGVERHHDRKGGHGHVHHTLKTMMRAYYAKFEDMIQLGIICKNVNTDVSKLPYLTKYMDNKYNKLCYVNVIDKCPQGEQCKFIHVSGHQILNAFATNLCTVIKPRVDYLVKNGQPSKGGSGKDCNRGNRY